MSFSKFVLNSADRLRPVLKKIIPAKMLSRAKAKLIEKKTKELARISIEPFDRTRYRDGINLIGNIRGDNGLGQSMRLVADILTTAKVDYTIHNFYVPPGGSMTNSDYDERITQDFPYNINLIHVNASEFTVAFMQLGQPLWDGRYNIAYWLWELEAFPQEWLNNLNLVDEIWTPAAFISNTLRRYTDKPVRTIPYPVTAPTKDCYDRTYFGLPKERFLFLMMFDSGSVMERKNPLGTIEAFKKAFGMDNREVGIVIKINEPEQSEEDIRYIHSVLRGYDNIYIICKTLSKTEVNSLIQCVDVFVSLHRAEGFGLVLAEAMLVGTPTIATNWSGNTEFMNDKVACMVDYKMIALEKDLPPFKKGYQWADADIGQAALYMKKLFEEPAFYERIKRDAGTYIREHLSMERSVALVEKRLKEILEETK